MDDFTNVVQGVVSAVRIDRYGSFTWFGSRTATISKAVRRSANRQQLLNHVRFRLQHQLYQSFYTVGFATPIGGIDESDRMRAPEFVDELSRANCGGGVEERGWKVLARGRSTSIISKHGLTVEVGADRISHSTGGTISFRNMKELLGVSPGFYTALGDDPLAPKEPLMRLYWNVHADGAVPFIRHATRFLNDESIPFRVKILNDPRRFDRCDAAVLYVARRDRENAYPIIAALYRRLEKHLKPLTPVFTKPIGRGVGVAEDPPGVESFGQHRCGIVADGLLRAHRKRCTTTQARFDEVVRAFEWRGISFREPFLNPGSADLYPPLTA